MMAGNKETGPRSQGPVHKSITESTRPKSTTPDEPVHDGYADLPGADKMKADERTAFEDELENLDWERVEEPDLDEPQFWPAPSEPMKVARKIAATWTLDKVCLIRRWRGDWLKYVGAHWEIMEDAAVIEILYRTLEKAVYDPLKPKEWAPNRNKISNVHEALAVVTYLEEKVNPPEWVPQYAGGDPTQLVVVNNGILDVTSRRLIPHDPRLFNIVSVPFDYDEEAPKPARWLTFLDELWPEDPESQLALQQWFGYVLSGRTDLHKILLLVGPTRAGKGVVARVLGALIGRRNVAGPTLSSLGHNFGLQPLIGKPLAIISDARLGSGTNVIVERLLSISGEDWLTIDRKYKAPWSGKLNTRFMVISNELPRFGDASGAIANRFVVLALRRSFLGEENTQLTDELFTELPGILNWALDGIQSLIEDGSFVEPATSKDAITQLQDLTSPVSAFVRDICAIDISYEIEKDDLWKAWKAWCEDNGRRPGSTASFGRDLFAAYPMIASRRKRLEDGTRLQAYQGIRLSANPGYTENTEKPNKVRAGQGDPALSAELNQDDITADSDKNIQLEVTLTHPDPDSTDDPVQTVLDEFSGSEIVEEDDKPDRF